MKLYHSSPSPNSRRARILIAEKSLDIELVPIDLGAKEQFSDAYRAINPRMVVYEQIPAVVERSKQPVANLACASERNRKPA
jgi:glutathione S-transferase